MCNKEIHELLIQESYVNCIFCNKQIVDSGKPRRYFCCGSMKLIKDDFISCKNCGQVHDEYFAPEYYDFYGDRHRIRKKSVYHRKYHIINVMNDIAQKNSIQIGYYNRENILIIFKLIDNVTQPDVCRKQLKSVNFIIKQLFDILGVEYKIIPLTRSKPTLKYYEDWWERVYSLIKDDISQFRQEVRVIPRLLIEREGPGDEIMTSLSAVLFYRKRNIQAISVRWERIFLACCFSNLVTNGAKSTIVSSSIFSSFRKSFLLNGPPRNTVKVSFLKTRSKKSYFKVLR